MKENNDVKYSSLLLLLSMLNLSTFQNTNMRENKRQTLYSSFDYFLNKQILLDISQILLLFDIKIGVIANFICATILIVASKYDIVSF